MGSKKDRMARFLKEHPHCCFCGGQTLAATQDHVPSRAAFRGRQWPEGYVFPACFQCNNSTAADEILTAFVCRMHPHPEIPENPTELQRTFDAVAETYPDVYKSLLLSNGQVRNWLRNRNMQLPPGTLVRDLPLVSIGHPRIHEAIHRYATKLFCALYYKHTGRVVPPAGGTVFLWNTNAQREDQLPDTEKLDGLLKGFPRLVRQNTSLHDQFSYRFATASDGAAVFHAFFNLSISMLGCVVENLDTITIPKGMKVLRPFNWSSPALLMGSQNEEEPGSPQLF